MPSTVESALDAAGLAAEAVVSWGEPVPEKRPGVYLVSLLADPHAARPTLGRCPIELDAIEDLLAARRELTLDGSRPTAAQLAQRLAAFWLPDEAIVYIGLAGSSLAKRVREYYRTPLGARSPHAGGWFLKTLEILPELHVHYATCKDTRLAEAQMLDSFASWVSAKSRAQLHDPNHPMPFANLAWPRGANKTHGIKGARAPR